MFCKHCKSFMQKVMRFENNRSYKLYRCSKCFSETKPKPYFFCPKETVQKNTKTNNKKPNKRFNNMKRR